MGFLDFWRAKPADARSAGPRVMAEGGAQFYSLNDPFLVEYLFGGSATATGLRVSVASAMRNTAMFRAVSLISGAIGMLPLQLIERGSKEKASAHPLYRLLHRQPNDWQTAYDFRSLMQLRALVKGNAYALIVRSRDVRARTDKIIRLIPLDPDHVKIEQADDWAVTYVYQPAKGARRVIAAKDMLHLRGLSLDGLNGVSLVKQASEAIALAMAAELAAGRLYKNGAFVSGGLKHPGKLSPDAFTRIKSSLADKEGADNAGKTLILEEGMEWQPFSNSARDAQMVELRKLQVEEIARVTGVPRPLLMVDETSWGSGIEALGRFFVQYALGPWFEAWQQAAERSLLTDEEKETHEVKFNPGALLRGSMKDQADFFAKALGAGGAPGWMTPNEVRDLNDQPADADPASDVISKGSMGAPAASEDDNDPTSAP